MSNKINEFKNRRYARLMERADAADDDKGRWITTENGHKVHLNEEGEPDKGNPHVVDKMKGGESGSSDNEPGKYSEKAHENVTASRNFVGSSNLERQARDYLNHHLGYGEEYADVKDFHIAQNPTENGLADVDVEYEVRVRIPVGRDPETGVEEYEDDYEYRTKTLQLKVLNGGSSGENNGGLQNSTQKYSQIGDFLYNEILDDLDDSAYIDHVLESSGLSNEELQMLDNGEFPSGERAKEVASTLLDVAMDNNTIDDVKLKAICDEYGISGEELKDMGFDVEFSERGSSKSSSITKQVKTAQDCIKTAKSNLKKGSGISNEYKNTLRDCFKSLPAGSKVSIGKILYVKHERGGWLNAQLGVSRDATELSMECLTSIRDHGSNISVSA